MHSPWFGGLPTQSTPIFDFLWHELFSDFPFLWLASLRGWALFDCGLFLLQPTLLLLSAVLLPFPPKLFCHSCCDVIRLRLARLLWVCYLFFSQWLSMVIGPFDYIACGFLCPVYFLLGILGPLTFLGHSWLFLILCFYGLLLTPLDFSNPITLSFILRAGLPSTPYFLCLHYFGLTVTYSHFSISRIAHGFTTSLFLGFFRPICFFKAHLFIL